jgi:hypothetical protein
MSIPGISPWSDGDAELCDMSIPGIADDVGLDASRITQMTALATARATAAMTMRRVRVMLVM